MRNIETIEEFYTRKFGGIPENIRKEIGHFNVFKLDPFVGENAKPVPYARRDYFKIMLVTGSYNMHYADGVAAVQKSMHWCSLTRRYLIAVNILTGL